MAPGDTQEVVVALVTGLGADRLSSISLMKFNGRFAQSAYDFGFTLPSPPDTPELSYTALDRKILLKWGEDQGRVALVERDHENGFRFEGYNLYQLASPHWNPNDATKIATFDRKNGVMAILEERFDYQNGTLNLIRIQNGTDSGVDYKLLVTHDQSNFKQLVNAREYYFAVTAYNYHPDKPFGLAALESAPDIVIAMPHTLNPGERWNATVGDTLPAMHIAGQSDGQVRVAVVDPSKMTGDTYRVTFAEKAAGGTVWSLHNVSKGHAVLSAMSNQSGDNAYLVTEGVQAIVTEPPPGIKEGDDGYRMLSGQRLWTWTFSDDFDLEGFGGTIGWGASYPYNGTTLRPHEMYDVIIKYAETDVNGHVLDPNDANFSYAYRYLANAANPPAKSEFAPYIKNPTGHFSFQDFTKSVPWAVFVYDEKTGEIGKRLSIGFLENNSAKGLVDGKWWPPVFSAASNSEEDGPAEWFWIFDIDYSEMPDTLLASPHAAMLNGAPKPILMWGTVARRFSSQGFHSHSAMAIFVNKPNSPNDVFTFQTIAPTYDDVRAGEDALRLAKAFPNPYYGPVYSSKDLPTASVTFTHLPRRAVIRIFNLAGNLVRVLEKESDSQFFHWDLLNSSGRFVASGLYIAHIDMPDLGVSKTLKLAIVQ
jgi:hypothetical protein